MDEVVYDLLNFESQIENKRFHDTIKEIVQQETNISKVKLSTDQLNSLFAILFSYGLHYLVLIHI